LPNKNYHTLLLQNHRLVHEMQQMVLGVWQDHQDHNPQQTDSSIIKWTTFSRPPCGPTP